MVPRDSRRWAVHADDRRNCLLAGAGRQELPMQPGRPSPGKLSACWPPQRAPSPISSAAPDPRNASAFPAPSAASAASHIVHASSAQSDTSQQFQPLSGEQASLSSAEAACISSMTAELESARRNEAVARAGAERMAAALAHAQAAAAAASEEKTAALKAFASGLHALRNPGDLSDSIGGCVGSVGHSGTDATGPGGSDRWARARTHGRAIAASRDAPRVLAPTALLKCEPIPARPQSTDTLPAATLVSRPPPAATDPTAVTKPYPRSWVTFADIEAPSAAESAAHLRGPRRAFLSQQIGRTQSCSSGDGLDAVDDFSTDATSCTSSAETSPCRAPHFVKVAPSVPASTTGAPQQTCGSIQLRKAPSLDCYLDSNTVKQHCLSGRSKMLPSSMIMKPPGRLQPMQNESSPCCSDSNDSSVPWSPAGSLPWSPAQRGGGTTPTTLRSASASPGNHDKRHNICRSKIVGRHDSPGLRRVSTLTESSSGWSKRKSFNNVSQMHYIRLQDSAETLKQITIAEQRGLAGKPTYVIDPRGRFMGFWDGVTSAALIFTALATPFEVAFIEPSTTALDGWFIVDRMLDIIFVLDMCFNFMIMYQLPATSAWSIELSRWEYRPSRIAKHYLQGWFTLDLLSVLPSIFDVVPVILGVSTDTNRQILILRIFRILRLVKLLRLLRTSRIIKRWENSVAISYSSMTLIAIGFQIGLATHWYACILSLQTTFYESRLDTWQGAFGYCWDTAEADIHGPGYPEDAISVEPNVECAPWNVLYIQCFYWALGIISGFISVPQMAVSSNGSGTFNLNEQVVNIVLVSLGALLWAYVTACFVDVIVNTNPDETAFKNTMDDLNRFCRHNRLAKSLASQLREYFHEAKEVQMAEQRRRIFTRMSPGLLDRVMWEINGHWLKKIPFFVNAERSFLSKMASELTAYVFTPREVPPSRRLYVIHRGCAKYREKLLSVGDMWGQVEMMLQHAHQHTAMAMTYLHVHFIASETVLTLAASHPRVLKQIRRWTAFEALKLYLLNNLRKERRRQNKAALSSSHRQAG